MDDQIKLSGFRRRDGRIGIRNLVVVMAAADNVNPVARQLVERSAGTVLLPASYGRGQLGADLEVTLDAMAGLAGHPNVAECLIVSFESASADRIAERVRAQGRDVKTLSFIETGGLEALLAAGENILREMRHEAERAKREPVSASDLIYGLECGGSDTTSGLFGNPSLGCAADRLGAAGAGLVFSEPVECLGAEAALRERAVSPEVGDEIVKAIERYRRIALDQGIDLTGINPTADNIAGGLTTIEEKSLGAVAKTGSRRIEGCLRYGQRPPGPGLWFMDAPAAAVENLTALAAGGAQATFFVTGSCNPIGHPISPTIKICANPETVARMGTHIDVDLSRGLTQGMSLDQAADVILEGFAAIAHGRSTAAERCGYLETNISRFSPSV